MGFYPKHASVPETLQTDRLLLRPLRETDAALDYDAVMSSADQLHWWSQSTWPSAVFTLEENRADLMRHEREHLDREAFTYTVMNLNETYCLGCVYIMPLPEQARQVCAEAAYSAHVGFWVRTSELGEDLDAHLFETLRNWFSKEWEFDCIVFIVSPFEPRQINLFKKADLEQLAAITLSGDRRFWVFG